MVEMATSTRVSETAFTGARADTVRGPRLTRFSSLPSLVRIWKLSSASAPKSLWNGFALPACLLHARRHVPKSSGARAGSGVGFIPLSSSTLASIAASSRAPRVSNSASMFCVAPRRASLEPPVKTRTDAAAEPDASPEARHRSLAERRAVGAAPGTKTASDDIHLSRETDARCSSGATRRSGSARRRYPKCLDARARGPLSSGASGLKIIE